MIRDRRRDIGIGTGISESKGRSVLNDYYGTITTTRHLHCASAPENPVSSARGTRIRTTTP